MLVLMALVTAVMTTPLVLGLGRGTELEPYLVRSGFVAGRPPAEAGAETAAFPPGTTGT
jgi:hypothetical protein